MLHMEFLGGLRMTLDGAPVTGFVSSKAQALLCYLAVAGKQHYRVTLANLLWGDQSDTAAATNLRQAIANLRRLVGPYLVIERTTIAFNPDASYVVDVLAFEHELTRLLKKKSGSHLLTPEELQSLEAALEHYRGDFLSGFTVRDAPDFDEWAASRQGQLRDLALSGLHTLMTQHAAQNDDPAAIRAAARLLTLDPWHEEAHRHMMLLLAHSGQQQAALAQYQRCRRVLWDELGVEPMLETTQLYERILAAQTDQRAPIVLPANSFVGRETERTTIRQWLSDPVVRLLTILGQGGVGKSRLAMHVAAEHQQRFLHGAAFVPLSAVASPTMLIPALAQALGLSFERPTDQTAQLIDYLREKELLLVLDNLEHLIDASSTLIADLLAAAPNIKLLVTSRERLRLQEEWLLTLDGLPLPASTAVEADQDDGALRLFVERVRQMEPGFHPQDSEWDHVRAICRLADGLPLAIELAASATRSLDASEVARTMALNNDVLQSTLRNVPERQRSMRATFEYSWQLLTPAEQQAFQRVSVFRGGFERAAATEVIQSVLLPAFVDKSLLYRTPSGRYGIHEMLRQYADEKLRQNSDDYAATRDRHLHWVTALVVQQAERLRSHQQAQALAAIQAEIENIQHAWQWGIERDHAVALDAALEGCFQFYEMRNRFAEGVDAFAAAAARFSAHGKAEHPRLVERLLARQAVLLHRLGNYVAARSLLQQSLQTARQRNDLAEIAFCSNNLGYVIYDQGEYDEARRLFASGRDSYRELGDLWGLASALTNLGLVGTAHEHIALLEESRALCQAIGDRRTLARILNNLGGLITDQGRYAEAHELLDQSLSIFEDINYRRGMAYVLHHICGLNINTGDYAAGWGFGQRCLALFGEIGEQRGIAVCQVNLSVLAMHLGQPDEAQHLIDASLSISTQLGDTYIQALVLDQLGILAQAGSAVERARQLHQQALALARVIGDETTVATVLNNLASATALAGETIQAHRYLLEALRISTEHQIVTVALDALYRFALLVQETKPMTSLDYLNLVVEHPASFQHTRRQARQSRDQLQTHLALDQVDMPQEQNPPDLLAIITARLLADAG